MRASPTTPAMIRRIQAAVEEHVSTPATGRGPFARLQRWGRGLASGQRTAIVVIGTFIPAVAAMVTVVRTPQVGLPCIAVAIISFWIAIAGVEGGGRWYRTADRVIAVLPRPVIVGLIILIWMFWVAGMLILWFGTARDALIPLAVAAASLIAAWGYVPPVLAVERIRRRVAYSTATDTTARLILLLSVILVSTWQWTRETEQKATTEIITLVLAIIGLLGVAMARGLTRRRRVLTRVVSAADDLYARLRAIDPDPATLIAAGLALDRAMSTRLTSGMRVLGGPVADTRTRTSLVALVHLVAGCAPPRTEDQAIVLLVAKATDVATIRREIMDYCMHVRTLLQPRIDIAE